MELIKPVVGSQLVRVKRNLAEHEFNVTAASIKSMDAREAKRLQRGRRQPCGRTETPRHKFDEADISHLEDAVINHGVLINDIDRRLRALETALKAAPVLQPVWCKRGAAENPEATPELVYALPSAPAGARRIGGGHGP